MNLNITITDNVLTLIDQDGDELEFDLVPAASGFKTFKTKKEATTFEWTALDIMRQEQEDFTREELKHNLAKFNIAL